jgi:peroxiredoxin
MATTDQTVAATIDAEVRPQAAQLPAAVQAAFGADQAALRAAGVPVGVAAPGTPMPDGALLDAEGGPTSLAATRAGRPAVVVLYRGAWCPYCNVALRVYERDLVPALRERGVALVAVSPQRPDGSLTMRERHALTYAVVSDPGNQLAHGLGVVHVPPGEALAAAASLGLDLAAVNEDGTAAVPMPTVVLVDAGGTIRWLDVHPDYTGRTEPAEILAAVAAHLPAGMGGR